ncbi:MAG TPA: flagellar biosynthesis protein FlhA [Spirochaetia bacterium]|nr:MAG: flagellar biosynthesis protein FlhA [Spirochaetes bacterium GWB1_36_13]HCL55598.1 flagellar biosynthesis protein FlhA [Spirochaetia bacterium]
MAEASRGISSLLRNSTITIAVGVIAIIMMLIIPLPAFMLDFLLGVNIAGSMIVLLTVLYINRAIDFSVFPTLILFSTIFRIALNISSTRLILSEGKSFDGKIISAFGEFVVGGNYVIGLIIFLILTFVQIIVITKGATRVSEVAARFTLDALPGKQMEITNELQSGLITEEVAKKKKKDLSKEVSFFGAMDGASKFVQGDVRVGMIITFINIIGGFIIGVAQQGLGMADAAKTFLKFTVGDGLVSQIPALLVSVASGVIVTRSTSDEDFGEDVGREMLSSAKPLFIASGFLVLLSILPGFPMITLLILAAFFGGIGYYIRINGPIFLSKEEKDKKNADAVKEKEAAMASEDVYTMIKVDDMELEIGYNLVPLVDPSQGGDLVDRIKLTRKSMALDLGLIVPPIRIRDNMRLSPNEYAIKIKGIEVGRGSLKIDKYLAIPPGKEVEEISGEEGIDPVYKVKSKWITEETRASAEKFGYSVVDCPTVVTTHLTEIIKNNGYELLGRQEVKKIIDSVRKDNNAVVEDATKNTTLGEIQKVLQNLLKEGVSIRNIVSILETIADYSASGIKNVDIITEKVRNRLGKQIIQQIMGDSDKLYIITLDPELEEELSDSLQETEFGFYSNLDPDVSRLVLNDLGDIVSRVGYVVSPLIVTGDRVRLLTRSIVEKSFGKVMVVSYTELGISQAKVEHIGIIKASEAVETA